MSAVLRDFREGDHLECERILRDLPDWFGIESSLVQYVQDTMHYPTWMAIWVSEKADAPQTGDPLGRPAIGFITVREHQARAAEIHCMAIQSDRHRHGIGRMMIQYVEDNLRKRGCEYLQVKTQGPSRPCAEYEATRRFYEAVGFVPLEELLTLWPGVPCLLLVKRL